MRTLIAFTLGFMLGRQLYFQLDQSAAKTMEAKFKATIKDRLQELGLSPEESDQELDHLQQRLA